MRKPTDSEGVICPDAVSKRIYPPEGVYDSKNPDGSKVTKGILTKHKHKSIWGPVKEDCDWSGHVVDVVPIVKKDAPAKMESLPDAKPYTLSCGYVLSETHIKVLEVFIQEAKKKTLVGKVY